MNKPNVFVVPRARLAFLFVSTAVALVMAPGKANAYPWMIRHEFTDCLRCHTDPSGAGLLKPYGRFEADQLLRYRSAGESSEKSPTADFMWGLFDTPAWFTAGGAFRAGGIFSKPTGQPTSKALVLMQADLQAEVRVGGFRANASLGGVSSDHSAASVVGAVVSREHWVGYGTDDDVWLVRAGRINLPFGVRMIEHNLFIRMATRTDLNDTQQHGVAVSYNGDRARGELMGIAGNYQVKPDAYRERGYSGFFEYALSDSAAVGASSLVTHAAQDIYRHVPTTRQAHGVFARVAPRKALALLAEGDYVLNSPLGDGTATMLQADYEPLGGLHLIGTGETLVSHGDLSYSAWLGTQVFLGHHQDLRFDAVRQSLVVGSMGPTGAGSVQPNRLDSWVFILQLHVYL